MPRRSTMELSLVFLRLPKQAYWATTATLVDARTGKYLEAVAVPTR